MHTWYAFENIKQTNQHINQKKSITRGLLNSLISSLVMSEEYPVKSLVEVTEIIAGQSPKGEFYNDLGDGLPFYQGKKEFQNKLHEM